MSSMRQRLRRTVTNCEICITRRPSAVQKLPRHSARRSSNQRVTCGAPDDRRSIAQRPCRPNITSLTSVRLSTTLLVGHEPDFSLTSGAVVGVDDFVQLREQRGKPALLRIEEAPLILNGLVPGLRAFRRCV